MNTYSMENPLCCDIKCARSPISGINPVNDSLSMCVLIMIHFTICITERIPILTNSKVRFSCIHIVLHITAPKSPNKIKPPSIISYFFPAGQGLIHTQKKTIIIIFLYWIINENQMETWIIEMMHINRISHQATENMDVPILKHDKLRYHKYIGHLQLIKFCSNIQLIVSCQIMGFWFH